MDKTIDEGVQKKIAKTIRIENMTMCYDEEQLTPIMTGQSRPQ